MSAQTCPERLKDGLCNAFHGSKLLVVGYVLDVVAVRCIAFDGLSVSDVCAYEVIIWVWQWGWVVRWYGAACECRFAAIGLDCAVGAACPPSGGFWLLTPNVGRWLLVCGFLQGFVSSNKSRFFLFL